MLHYCNKNEWIFHFHGLESLILYTNMLTLPSDSYIQQKHNKNASRFFLWLALEKLFLAAYRNAKSQE